MSAAQPEDAAAVLGPVLEDVVFVGGDGHDRRDVAQCV